MPNGIAKVRCEGRCLAQADWVKDRNTLEIEGLSLKEIFEEEMLFFHVTRSEVGRDD